MNFDLTKAVLTDELAGLKEDIIQSHSSKGLRGNRLLESIRIEVVTDTASLTGSIYVSPLLIIQDKGRKPNASGKPSRLMVERIAKWVEVTGLSISPWAIATKIAKEGIKVPNRFNPGGVLSEPLDPERVKQKIRGKVRESVFGSLKSALRGESSTSLF